MHRALAVYIDFKSPYAYLAVEPTRRLARELGINVDWVPFVLDIPSYLGSARLDKSGEVADQSRSANQWSMVKYAYFDCRRYASLRGQTIRGTVKIWDSNLAAIGMLWAKRQGDDILHRYIDGTYEPFWKRELDVEDVAVVEGVLAGAGAEVNGFRHFCRNEGAAENDRIQHAAFERGIFGVPSYVLGDEIYFGREHLPRIRWLLRGATGACPDIAYELAPDAVVGAASDRTLGVGIARQEPESLLAIPAVLTMSRELGVAVSWYALPKTRPGRQPDADDQSRGARHRRFRSANRKRDRNRYMAPGADGADIERSVSELIEQNKISLQDGDVPDTWSAMGSAPGYVGSPVFHLGDEVFVGRQHLPLIRARFEKLAASQ